MKKETLHPFFFNYDISVPRGIYGDDIASVQLETGENIVMENPHYVYEPK